MFDGFINQDFGLFYLISQIFALLSIIFDLVAIQQRKKARLLNMDTMAAFCSFLHYIFLAAWPGVVNKAITTARNGIAAYKASRKKRTSKYLPFIFITFYIVLGIVTFESPISLLPMIAASVYTATIYWCDVKKIRYASIFTNILWLIYNLSVFSIVGIAAQILLIINGLIAVYRYRKKPKTSNNKHT